MAQGNDPEKRAEELIREMDAALKNVERMVAETDSMYSEMGLTRESAGNFINNKLSAAEKEQMEKELAAWNEEIERDVAAAVDSASGAPKPAKMKMNRMRV